MDENSTDPEPGVDSWAEQDVESDGLRSKNKVGRVARSCHSNHGLP